MLDIIDAYIQVHSENQVNFGAALRESIGKRVRDPRPGNHPSISIFIINHHHLYTLFAI